MSRQAKSKTDAKKMAVRIISFVLAGLMVLSVVMATVWQW